MTPEERKKLDEETKKAIKDKGFYGSNHVWNALITFPGDKHIYRHRVETIVIRNGKEIFVKKKPNGDYFLPGGSVERNIEKKEQAANECREEAHFLVKNIEPSGYNYKEVTGFPKWASEENITVRWDGRYTEIFVAEYDKPYKGKVAKVDEDPFMRSGRWYSKKECFKFFRQEHRDALMQYLRNKKDEPQEEEVTEGYVFNYFANRIFLKKLGKEPEISRKVIIALIKDLKKYYDKLVNSKHGREVMKKKDVGQWFFPKFTFELPNMNSAITIALSLDKSEFTPGAAFESESYGDVVVIYPCFFDETFETQIFMILHEIGHIRLGHTKKWNIHRNIFGQENIDAYRHKLMGRGKVMYPEVNADLYAVLNGAKLFAILAAYTPTDTDGEYDYRFTNHEFANRYSKVWDKYKKWRRPYEMEYYAKNNAATKLAYSESLDLPDEDKDRLYKLIIEYFINPQIDKDKYDKYYKETGDKELSRAKSIYCEEVDYDNPIDFFYKLEEEAKEDILDGITELVDKFKKARVMNEGSTELLDKYIVLLESLTSAERKAIPLDEFGIPEERKYPLDTKKHVESAIRLFGHCDPKYRKDLAKRIKRAMKKFGIPRDFIGPKSTLNEYI